MIRWLAFGLALALASSASAQNATTQNGTVVPGDVTQWARDRTLQDPGGILGRPATGIGVNPFAITDNNGLGLCSYTAATTGVYRSLCLGHDSSGNALLSFDGGGTFNFIANGTTYPFPGPGNGNVLGPSPAAPAGNAAVWNGGFLLRDGGIYVGSVPTNAVLLATSTTAFPNGVWRINYSTGFGEVPLFYKPSGVACTLSAGAGDNGSQVKSSDNKCWLAQFDGPVDPRQWGVTFNGTTDDGPLFQKVVDWQNANQGAATFPPTGGTILTGQTFNYTSSFVSLLCPGGMASSRDISQPPGGCWIKAKTSGSLNYLVTAKAPFGSTANGVLEGVKIMGVNFDGNSGDARGALNFTSVRDGTVESYTQNFNGGEIFTLDVVHSTGSNFGGTCDSQGNNFRVTVLNYGYTSDAIGLHGWVNPGIANNGCNPSLNYIDAMVYYGVSGDGRAFVDEGGDNNTIRMTAFRGTGGTGAAIDLRMRFDGGHAFAASSEIFDHLSTNAPIMIRGRETYPSCTDTLAGFSEFLCPTNIQFTNVDIGNGTPSPTAESGVYPYINYNWQATSGKNLGAVPWPKAITLSCEGTGGAGGTGLIGPWTTNGLTWSKTGSFVQANFDITLGTVTGCTGPWVFGLPVPVSNVTLHVGPTQAINVTLTSLGVGPVDPAYGVSGGGRVFWPTNPPATGNRIIGTVSYATTF